MLEEESLLLQFILGERSFAVYSSNFTTTYRLFQRNFFNVMWVIYLKTELLFDYFEWIVHICLFLTCNLDSVMPWGLNAQDPCHTVIILIIPENWTSVQLKEALKCRGISFLAFMRVYLCLFVCKRTILQMRDPTMQQETTKTEKFRYPRIHRTKTVTSRVNSMFLSQERMS